MPPIMFRSSTRLWVFFAIQVVGYAGLAAEHYIYGTLTHGQLPMTLSWVDLAFVGYGLTIWQVEKEGGLSVRILWLGTILFRALLLLTLPTLSSDIYRYLWDGYVANNGVSPYAFPIESAQLDYLDHPIRALANHTWMASPYLPAAQWLFGAVTAWLPINPLSIQITMVLIDLASGLLIMAILGSVELPKYRAIIYLWNPLVVVEIAQGAHIDGWMIFLTMLAIWLAVQQREGKMASREATWSQSKNVDGVDLDGSLASNHMGSDTPRNRQQKTHRQTIRALAPWHELFAFWKTRNGWLVLSGLAPVILAFATLTKILPAFLIAILFWRWRWWRLLLFGSVVAGFLLFAGTRAGWGLTGPLDGHGLFGALRIYGDQWNYNSGLFHWLEDALGPNGWIGWEKPLANQWAKRIVGVGLLAILGSTWLRARTVLDNRSLLRLMAVPLMGYVLLSATMHPWYLLLLLSFMPFLTPSIDENASRWLAVLPWLYLSGALFLSYLTYLDPQNLREYEWIRQTEWLPTLGLLVLAMVMGAGLLKADGMFTFSK